PHHHPRDRHAALPFVGGAPRRLDPGPQFGQAQDVRAGPGGRHLPGTATSSPSRGAGHRGVDRGGAHHHHRGAVSGRRAAGVQGGRRMRIEIVAVGTELLLGQIADTNSAWLGDRLAWAWVTSHFHQAVGDNHERITLAFRTALARSDGIIVCGGLGPTQDDITREAIADVMGVELVRDQSIVDLITGFFGSRGRTMSANNLRQADVPVGATLLPQVMGTAPGLICPLGNKVIYAVPGVPHEMAEMFARGILPDLRARMAEAGEEAVIVSRVLRTWGASESGLAEALQGRIDVLDADDADSDGVPAGSVTLAFLASGIEGIKVRITARAATLAEGTALLDREEKAVREAIEVQLGDIVFGIDDESMEVAVAAELRARGITLGVAESLTGGLIASRLG